MRPLNSATRSFNSATRQKCNYDPNGLPYMHCVSIVLALLAALQAGGYALLALAMIAMLALLLYYSRSLFLTG